MVLKALQIGGYPISGYLVNEPGGLFNEVGVPNSVANSVANPFGN